MVEVSADNIVLNFASDQAAVSYIDQIIDDDAGNGDGFLDPGETVDLITIVRNFGEPAFDATGVITTDDPYLTILDPAATFGDIPTGDVADNSTSPFVVQADNSTPTGYLAEVTLTITSGDMVRESRFDVLIGRYNYLIWDCTLDQSSGPIISTILAGLGYSGSFNQELPLAQMHAYQTLFVSAGIYSNNFLIAENSPEALAIEAFLAAGGCVYLEGADVWYNDPLYNAGHDFGPLFGINGVSDGSSDMNQVLGQDFTFTEGMTFTYVGENSYMDQLAPGAAGAVEIFRNQSPSYGCGVAFDAGSYKTVGTSFEFGGLVDGVGISTKAALATAIMEFFLPNTTEVSDLPAVAELELTAWPNPFNPQTVIHYDNPAPGLVTLTIHDIAGRRVRMLVDEVVERGSWNIAWDGRDEAGRELASGVYFAHIQAGRAATAHKLVLVR